MVRSDGFRSSLVWQYKTSLSPFFILEWVWSHKHEVVKCFCSISMLRCDTKCVHNRGCLIHHAILSAVLQNRVMKMALWVCEPKKSNKKQKLSRTVSFKMHVNLYLHWPGIGVSGNNCSHLSREPYICKSVTEIVISLTHGKCMSYKIL